MRRLFVDGQYRWTLLAMAVAAAALLLAAQANRFDPAWYRSLERPAFLPPALERAIPVVWAVLFALGGVGLAFAWASGGSPARQRVLAGLLAVQLALNMTFSYTFSVRQDLWGAVAAAAAVAVATAGVIAWAWPWSRPTAWCFAPYLAWVLYASAVAYRLAALNPTA